MDRFSVTQAIQPKTNDASHPHACNGGTLGARGPPRPLLPEPATDDGLVDLRAGSVQAHPVVVGRQSAGWQALTSSPLAVAGPTDSCARVQA